MRSHHAVAIVAAMLSSSAAQAQGADQDVRCLLASNLFVRAEKEQAKRQVALLSSYFYLGRVDARLSGTALSAALKEQAATITPANAGSIMTECAKRLQSAGRAIQLLGKDLR